MLSSLDYQSQSDLNPMFQTKNHKSNLQTRNSQFLQYDVYSGEKKEYLTKVFFLGFLSLNNDTFHETLKKKRQLLKMPQYAIICWDKKREYAMCKLQTQ